MRPYGYFTFVPLIMAEDASFVLHHLTHSREVLVKHIDSEILEPALNLEGEAWDPPQPIATWLTRRTRL